MTRIERFVRRHPLGAAALAGLALLAGPATLLSRSGWIRPPAESVQATRGPAAQEGSARELLSAVRGANPVLCELAIRQLGNQWGSMAGEEEDVPAALPEDSRRVLAWTEGKLEGADVAPLRDALADPDACARRTAARLLGRIETPEAVDALLGALRSGDRGRQEAALLGLAHTDDP